MGVTKIDVDDGEAAREMRNLGAAIAEESVNAAPHEVNALRRRSAALERMAERYERGEFDAAVAAWERRKTCLGFAPLERHEQDRP